jgi:hypothetical protein
MDVLQKSHRKRVTLYFDRAKHLYSTLPHVPDKMLDLIMCKFPTNAETSTNSQGHEMPTF